MRRMLRDFGVAALVIGAAACAGQPEADKAVVGQDVAVTKSDGGVVEGKVTQKDDKTVQVTRGKTTRLIPKERIADVKVVDATKPVVLPPVAKFREYTVAEGTKLSLKLGTAVSSATSKVEDTVDATLAEPVSVDGAEVLPAGSVVKGIVAAVEGSGRVQGLASITLKFQTVRAYDTTYDIGATYAETAQPTKGEDAKKIGGGAAAGAVIGAILGGGKGAKKGAVIGGVAGTGVVVATKGKEVEYGAGATLTAATSKAIDVKVPIK